MTVRVGRNFHIVHMTGDLRELDLWYYDVLSVQRFQPDNYMPAEKRDASLVLVGDLCMEPLAPAFRVDGWDEMPLGRFYNRFGSRLHSLAWYVDEGFDELYQRLHDAGIRMFGTGGVTQQGGVPQGALFTHPRDTCTQLEFMVAPSADGPRWQRDPRYHAGWSPRWWADIHPLHIERASYATVSVRDVDAARDLYVDVLGATLLHEGENPATRSRDAYVLLGDLVVDFAQPLDAESPLAEDMERFGPSLASMTFEVADLASAEAHLTGKGVRLAVNDGTTLVSDPATTGGAVMCFTSASVPGDPRPKWSEGGGLPPA